MYPINIYSTVRNIWMPLRPNTVFRPSEKWNRCVIIAVLKQKLFLRIFPLHSVCINGTFGYNCEMTCGSCKNDRVCSKTHGTCPSGCKAGFKLDTCLEGKCSLIFFISSAKNETCLFIIIFYFM